MSPIDRVHRDTDTILERSDFSLKDGTRREASLKTYAFPVSLGLSTAELGTMLFFVINAILCLWMARLKDDRHEMKISGR